MIKLVLTAMTTLCLLLVPILGLADQSDRQVDRVDQRWHSTGQALGVDGQSHRQSVPKPMLKVYRTDRHAVQQRVVKQRLYLDSEYRQRGNRRWQPNHLNVGIHIDFYNDYYSYDNSQHLGHHSSHSESFQGYHGWHKKHHQDESDYVEWLAILSLLNEIYHDE